MKILDQIHILGTSHISKQSLKDIKKEFLNFEPDIICVELDRQRLASLMQGDSKLSWKVVKILGVRGFIFVLISRYAQQKLGKMVGMKPGSEMLYAAQLAKNNNLPLGLIDKPIDKTIKRLMKKITFIEVMRFFKDIIISIIPFKHKKKIKINLAEVPAEHFINQLIDELAKKYPSVYKVLIDERNHYMAKRLIVISKKEPHKKILSIVGAGHKKEMIKLIDSKIKNWEYIGYSYTTTIE